MRDLQMNKIAAGKETNVNWPTVAFLIVFHVASVVALFFWSWPALLPRRSFIGSAAVWHRHGLPSSDDAPRLQSPESSGVLPDPSVARWRSKADRYNGPPRIVFTTLTPISREIHTRRVTGAGGRTSAGFWRGQSNCRTRPCCSAMHPI